MFTSHHISISVSNLERSKNFYSKLGFKELLQYNDPAGEFSISQLKIDDLILELFNYKKHQPIPQNSLDLSTDLREIGVKHFGLQVPSIEKAEKYLEEIEIIKKVEINKGKTGVLYFFIKDPDGMLVEISEDHRKS